MNAGPRGRGRPDSTRSAPDAASTRRSSSWSAPATTERRSCHGWRPDAHEVPGPAPLVQRNQAGDDDLRPGRRAGRRRLHDLAGRLGRSRRGRRRPARLALASWVLGWVLGPMMGGGDPGIRREHLGTCRSPTGSSAVGAVRRRARRRRPGGHAGRRRRRWSAYALSLGVAAVRRGRAGRTAAVVLLVVALSNVVVAGSVGLMNSRLCAALMAVPWGVLICLTAQGWTVIAAFGGDAGRRCRPGSSPTGCAWRRRAGRSRRSRPPAGATGPSRSRRSPGWPPSSRWPCWPGAAAAPSEGRSGHHPGHVRAAAGAGDHRRCRGRQGAADLGPRPGPDPLPELRAGVRADLHDPADRDRRRPTTCR